MITRRARLAVSVVLLTGCVAVFTYRAREQSPLTLQIALSTQIGVLAADPRTGQILPLDAAGCTGIDCLHRLDPASGTLVRVSPVALPQPVSLAVDGAAGRIAVLNREGAAASLTLLDSATGRLVRVADLNPTSTGLTIDEATHRLFVTAETVLSCPGLSPCSGVRTFDTRTGRWLGTYIVPGGGLAVAADPRSGMIAAVSESSGTLAVSIFGPHHTTPIRTLSFNSGVWPGAAFQWDTGLLTLATGSRPTVPDQLVGVDIRTGQTVRTIQLDSQPRVLASDAEGGALIAVLGPVRTVAIASGTASSAQYLEPTGRGTLYHLRRDAKSLQWRTPVGVAPQAMTIDASRHLVFVVAMGSGNTSGSLSVVDGRNGHLRHTIQLPGYPSAIALDRRERRVVVLCQGRLARAQQSISWLPSELRRYLPFLPSIAAQSGDSRGHVVILDEAQL